MNASASNGNPARGKARKRAVEACGFCRRRKIKCNNEQPACANCRTYGQECKYEPIGEANENQSSSAARHRAKVSSRRSTPSWRRPQGRPGPSDSDHASPLSDNRHVEALSPTDESDHTVSIDQQGHDSLGPLSAPRASLPDPRIASYHGRTSALFDETLQDRPPGEVARSDVPDIWVEKGLVAEAARQRQLEEINYRSGQLDFDIADPELGMHLLSLHWNRQHHSFLITYRPAFMRDMACGGPYFSKLLLNAIYFGAAKFSPRLELRKEPNDPRTAGWRYRERVRELLGESLDRSDITTIQALLVMTNSLFALGDERNAAWLYSGLAFRMITDLGIHVDITSGSGNRKLSDEEVEMRRRVFWGAFVVDKIQSLYQGRAASLRESDALVPIKFLDTFEELEPWKPFAYSSEVTVYSGSPAYSVTTFSHLCSLSVIMSDILSTIYAERKFDEKTGDLSAMLQNLHQRLSNWRQELPIHLSVDSRSVYGLPLPPNVLSLQTMYHVLVILLHRPFVTDGHLHNLSRAMSVNSFKECASAASRIVRILQAYDAAFSVRRAPYLISYATYVAATILVRIAAKSGRGSQEHRDLQICLGVFRDNQETNWAVRRANFVIRNLMKRLNIDVDEDTQALVEGGANAAQLVRSVPPSQGSGGRTNQGVQGRDTFESPREWLNIDEIMQTFVRDDVGMQQGLPQTVGLNQGGTRPVPQLEQGVLRPDALQAQFNGGSMNKDYYNTTTWHDTRGDGMGMGELNSVDDLLFGFNGSALDSFALLNWEVQ